MADEQVEMVEPVVEQPEAADPAPTQDTPAEPEQDRKIPYSRFEEVVREKQSLAAEKAALAAQFEFLREQMSRLNPPKPEEEEDLDPAEMAMREARNVRKELEVTKENLARQAAMAAIEKAVVTRRLLDADDAKERLAERFFLARQTGRAFDADREAELLAQKQEAALKKMKVAWANEKTKAAVATATPAASPSPPAGRAPEAGPPPWGTPERRKWEEDQVKSVFAEFRG